MILFFFIVGAGLKWFPETDFDKEYQPGLDKSPPEYIFCEGYVEGWILQPISVWTDLAFITSGVALMLMAAVRSGGRSGSERTNLTPIEKFSLGLPTAYSMIVLFMGPGSMYYHASLKDWCGWADWFSIANWASFGFGYTLWRMLDPMFDKNKRSWLVWVFWLGMAVPVGIVGACSIELRDELRYLTIGLWVGLEGIFMIMIGFSSARKCCECIKIRRNGWMFVGTLFTFLAAFGFWIPSGGVESLRVWCCNPDSSLQGHGYWHIFAAAGTFMVYLHWSEERNLRSGSS